MNRAPIEDFLDALDTDSAPDEGFEADHKLVELRPSAADLGDLNGRLMHTVNGGVILPAPKRQRVE